VVSTVSIAFLSATTRTCGQHLAAVRAVSSKDPSDLLAAADVFTEDTTFEVTQSIWLELRYGSWVHP
jgi:hypothetical protein